MPKITGLGGAFLRVQDPEALYLWYQQHLGISSADGFFSFPQATQRARIAVAFFPKTSAYFPVSQSAMLNFQVDDVDGVLDSLLSAGVPVDPNRETTTTDGSAGSPILKGTASNFGSPVVSNRLEGAGLLLAQLR